MTVHDVMEVMTMEPSFGLGALDELDVDAAFADIVLADDDLVDLEFEALISAEFGDPTGTGGVPHDLPDGPAPTPRPGDAPTPAHPAARITAARGRNRQRGPPVR